MKCSGLWRVVHLQFEFTAALAGDQVPQLVVLVITLDIMTARQGDQLLSQLVLAGVVEGSFDVAELFFNRKPQSWLRVMASSLSLVRMAVLRPTSS